MDAKQITWLDLTNPQRQTLYAIDVDTRLELRHSYYMPWAKRLLELGLIAVDGDGYIVTEAGQALAATPQPSAVDIEGYLRTQLATAQAERDRYRAALGIVRTGWVIECGELEWRVITPQGLFRDTDLAAAIERAALEGGADKKDSRS